MSGQILVLTYLLTLVTVAIFVGFAIGCADRKWWRGPKPPMAEPEPPTADEIASAVVVKLDASITTAIAKHLPNEEQFRTTVATLVQDTVGQVSKLVADMVKPVPLKKRRRVR